MLLDNAQSARGAPAKRPNFVWILSEDNSVHHMDLYCKTGAAAPRIRELARDGVVFNHAFSGAPVCSTARTMLATGCYGSRIGTQYHRATWRRELPEDVEPVFAVMKDAGYFTSNQGKTDYNFDWGTYWRSKAWQSQRGWRDRHRKPGQPFFCKQTVYTSHESRLHKANKALQAEAERGVDAQDTFVQPRHPDTPLFRATHRYYNTLVTRVDSEVGRVVDALREDGLLEDTFIFYFGEHGGVLPGSKGYAYETGLHVPLVVRIPAKFKHLVDLKRGSRADGFVEFIDFGATIMHLAGIIPPAGIDGKPFMGPGISSEDLESRDEAFGMADRMDHKVDFVRTLRKGRLKYMRSYTPYYPDGLKNNYRYRMAAYKQWRRLYEKGELNAVQAQFFEPRAPEALYDVVSDPYETVNLAKDPGYAEELKTLRARFRERMRQIADLSMYPESHLYEVAKHDPAAFGQEHKGEIVELLTIADLSLLSFAEAKAGIAEALASSNPWKRYWGLIVCSGFMTEAEPFVQTAKALAADDKNLYVRFRAAEFLGLIGAQSPDAVFRDVRAKLEARIGRESKEARRVFRTPGYLIGSSKTMLETVANQLEKTD
jgi:arylsulfatase A-like enzyme